MKEAIGGSWLYTLAIVLIALFTTFVSVTTNYNRTYKIKDHVISLIEANDGVTKKTLEDINTYLSSLGYSSTGNCPEQGANGEKWFGFSYTNSDGPVSYSENVNYCIYKHTVVCTNIKNVAEGRNVIIKGSGGYNTFPRAYYGVMTFFRLDWPILRYVVKLNLSGETSPIFMVNHTNSNEITDFAKMNECGA